MTIFYFTGTGNSFDIAKKIAGEDIVSISKVIEDKILPEIKGDNVGIVFPVYGFSAPQMVLDFADMIKDKLKDKYVFIIANYGGMSGNVDIFLKEKLEKIDAYLKVKMPSNDIFFTRMADDKEQEKILKEAYVKIEKFKKIIENKEKIPYKHNVVSEVICKFFKKLFNLAKQPKFYCIKEKCVSCGMCVKVCPSKNIVLNANGNPDWQEKCIFCTACVQTCPVKAINTNKKMEKQPRYVNPNYKAFLLKK